MWQWAAPLETIAPALARAWVHGHHLYHLGPAAAAGAGAGRLPLRAATPTERWRHWRGGLPQSFDLVLADTAPQAEALFDQEGFAWWAQAQCLWLWPATSPPPDLAPADVLALLSRPTNDLAGRLRQAGVHAVIRPLVDGAGALISPLETGVEQALQQAGERAGLAFE